MFAAWFVVDDANRGPGGLDPDHPGSPSSFSAVAQCTLGDSCAVSQSFRRFRPKTDPAKSKITRFEAALKALGQEQSEARACLEEALKKAKTEGSAESRDTTSRPPEASLAEANAKISRLEGSLAALGPDDIAERRVLEDALAKVRARAIVAPVGQRLDECEKYCEQRGTGSCVRSIEGADSTRGRVGKGETLFGSSPIRSRCQPVPVPQPTDPGTDELTHLRSHVAQLEGDLRQSHWLAIEKISVETSLKQRIDLLMQEVTALKVTSLPVSRSGSALLSDLIEEADKKRTRVHGEGAQ